MALAINYDRRRRGRAKLEDNGILVNKDDLGQHLVASGRLVCEAEADTA